MIGTTAFIDEALGAHLKDRELDQNLRSPLSHERVDRCFVLCIVQCIVSGDG
jgi:hypothetical protein